MTRVPAHSRRALVALAATALVPLVLLAQGGTGAPADAAEPRYRATITRTDHGIPHVVADDWGSLGFGSGYAMSETTACNLLDTVVTARAERSLTFGPDARYDDEVTLDATNLQVDALVTDLRNRRVVERLMDDPDAGPGRQARRMVRGYVAGANAYLARHADDITDPACRGAA